MRQTRIAPWFAPIVLIAALAQLTGFLATANAYAACQAYRSDPIFLAELQTDEFLKKVFAGAVKFPDLEQIQKLRDLGQQRPPDRLGELAQLEGWWRISGVTSIPFTITVPVPHTVDIRPSRFPIRDLIKADFDADGDGKADWAMEGEALSNNHSHRYDKEGEFENTLRLYDRSGQVYASSSRLRVVSQDRFDAELQTVWADFKAALHRNDLPAALECIHTQSRVRYKQSLAAIPELSKKVDDILGPIKLANPRPGMSIYEMSIYEMVRVDSGVALSYEVRFVADFDAVWRIRSF